MDYIPDVDEMLMPPPFRLGRTPGYQIQGHTFVIPANSEVLQRLLNKHLNVPLGAVDDPTDPWNIGFGTARHRTTAGLKPPEKLKYVVLNSLYGVVLNVLRYWRVDAEKAEKKGYIAYTELIFQFLVHRIREAEPQAPAESLYFLGVVYIDDSAFRGELQDPESLPILLGREAYGLPKNPGQIYYCPHDEDNALGPRLNIWDYDATTIAKLALEPAITVNPATWTTPSSDYCPCQPEPVVDGTPYGPLLAQLQLEHAQLNLRPFEDERDPFREHARILTLPPEKWLSLPKGQVVKEIVIRNDLHLFAKLVGLKQFPDPTSDLPGGVDACYRAVVESAVEHENQLKPVSYAVVGDQEIEFHTRNRVHLADAFGITTVGGRIKIPDVNVYYTMSDFLFGRPQRTDVWEPA